MIFYDLYSEKYYSLFDLWKDWKVFLSEDPLNHANDFKTELFEIILATINGRNDFEIIGYTHKEIDHMIFRIRILQLKSLMNTNPNPQAYSYEIGCLHPNNSQKRFVIFV